MEKAVDELRETAIKATKEILTRLENSKEPANTEE